jgi:transcriptional regulator with XRE-family HTH domain
MTHTVIKTESIFRFTDPFTKVLLMMALKRRLRYIMKQTKFSRAQIVKESGINIAYIVYILRMEVDKVSDNVVRSLAVAFEIFSLDKLFSPHDEALRIQAEKYGPKMINAHRTIDHKSLWVWGHEYYGYQRILHNTLSIKKQSKSLANLVGSDKVTIPDILTGGVKIDKPDSPDQRRFDFQQATKVVEEQKKVEKIRESGKVSDKYEVLIKLLREKEADLLNELTNIKALIGIYKKQ